MTFRAAFYKGSPDHWNAKIFAILVKWWTKSEYSHCELVFSDGYSASASFMDGGVRFKKIIFDPEHWDFIDLPEEKEQYAREWFMKNNAKRYDVMGNLGFVIGSVSSSTDKWFCSEAVAAALNIVNPERFYPGSLKALLDSIQTYARSDS